MARFEPSLRAKCVRWNVILTRKEEHSHVNLLLNATGPTIPTAVLNKRVTWHSAYPRLPAKFVSILKFLQNVNFQWLRYRQPHAARRLSRFMGFGPNDKTDDAA